MLLLTIVSLLLFLFNAALPGVHAKCCSADSGGDCGDDSPGTPCCGYKSCNAFCCACEGVQVIRGVLEKTTTGKKQITWTTVITAPPPSTWTCRASHVTTLYPLSSDAALDRKRDVQATIVLRDDNNNAATITHMPRPNSPTSTAAPVYDPQMLAELQGIFNHVCGGRKHNGVGVIDLEDYFGFFNVTADRKDTDFAKNVEAKFHAHDVNGDGMLTMDEVKWRCRDDGCV